MNFSIDQLPRHEEFVSEPSDVVYLSGSRLEGFGNDRSDYDLFIVYSERLERVKGGPRQFILDDERRIDLERYSWDHLSEVATRINEQDPQDAAGIRRIAVDGIDLYYRTAIAVPVVNAERFALLQSRFTRKQAARIYGAWARERSRTFLGEARVAGASADHTGTYLLARRALIAAVETLTAARGEGYPAAKWAFLKLARHYPVESPEYQRAWRLRTLGQEPVAAYLNAVSCYCQEVGIEPAPPSPWSERTVRSDDKARLFVVAGRNYVVHHKMFLYELNDTARDVWRLLDGKRTVRAVAAALAGRHDVHLETVVTDVEAVVAQLCKHGLVRTELELVQVEL